MGLGCCKPKKEGVPIQKNILVKVQKTKGPASCKS